MTMSRLSDYIQNVLDEGSSPETARRAMESYEKMHPPLPGIPVNIELSSDDDLSKCPRCGANIDRQPQPSLHASSTFYECDTEVITTIESHPISIINRMGHKCVENVDKIRKE